MNEDKIEHDVMEAHELANQLSELCDDHNVAVVIEACCQLMLRAGSMVSNRAARQHLCMCMNEGVKTIIAGLEQEDKFDA